MVKPLHEMSDAECLDLVAEDPHSVARLIRRAVPGIGDGEARTAGLSLRQPLRKHDAGDRHMHAEPIGGRHAVVRFTPDDLDQPIEGCGTTLAAALYDLQNRVKALHPRYLEGVDWTRN